MDESIAYGVPGIFIPIKNHFEQEEGAKRLGYTYKDIRRIDTLIEEKLDSQRNIMANTSGADKAAKSDSETALICISTSMRKSSSRPLSSTNVSTVDHFSTCVLLFTFALTPVYLYSRRSLINSKHRINHLK